MELDRNQDIENHIYAINGAAVEVHKILGFGQSASCQHRTSLELFKSCKPQICPSL